MTNFTLNAVTNVRDSAIMLELVPIRCAVDYVGR